MGGGEGKRIPKHWAIGQSLKECTMVSMLVLHTGQAGAIFIPLSQRRA